MNFLKSIGLTCICCGFIMAVLLLLTLIAVKLNQRYPCIEIDQELIILCSVFIGAFIHHIALPRERREDD